MGTRQRLDVLQDRFVVANEILSNWRQLWRRQQRRDEVWDDGALRRCEAHDGVGIVLTNDDRGGGRRHLRLLIRDRDAMAILYLIRLALIKRSWDLI